ncbi:MAG: tail fiber assembly protein [Pseudomonas sp.]|nr:tail fiber assembly protein [Pseudomonas sp.]
MANELVIYHADSITGEYIGSGLAAPDPLEPGKWILPARAFTEEPPIADEGYVAVCTPGAASSWTLQEDQRGIVYSIQNGESVQLDQLGPVPEGFTKDPRPSPYHAWIGGKWKLDKDAERTGQIADAVAMRDNLIRDAATRIAPLQDAVDLGEATDEDVTNLKKWKQYRVALNRIDQQSGYPATIDWPVAPT